jgi:putative two-component system response regulator
LSPEEFEIMKTHSTLASEAVGNAEQTLGISAELLKTVKELTLSHHEKWDGSGYPQGLSAHQIPVSARLMAIADVYDALISDRIYKAGVPHDEAVAIIFQGRASHFDPDMVDVFIEIQDDFHAIAERFADTELDMQKKMEYMANAIAEDVRL